jgi:putative tricarboxylic transport membrane protein
MTQSNNMGANMHLSFMKKYFVAAGIATIASMGMPNAAVAECEFPCKPIIFVAPGSLGGGSDTQARLAMNIVTDAGIFGDEPVAVLNKGGGGSQEAFTFMISHSDDPHYLLTFQASLITYTLLGEAQYELSDFTPIANVAQDPTMIVARPDTGWKTLDDMIQAAKANPGGIPVGGGGVSGPDRMGLITLEKDAGFEIRYIPYSGGSNIHRAVLGGEIVAAAGNPSDFMASLESGDLIGLALMDTKRGEVGPMADIPTTVELGYPNAVFGTFRGWFAAGDIDDDTMATLEKSFKAVTDHPDFKAKYIDRFGMRLDYMDHTEFAEYLDGRVSVFSKILKDAGVIQ